MTTPTEEPRQNNGPENEVRVSGKTNVFNALKRIEEALKNYDHIVLSGINTGISKVLLITEISKIKFPGLHQYNLIETITMEMKDDEKDEVDSQKFLTRFKVELHKNKPSNPPKGFYQAPYTEEELKKINEAKANDDGDRERPRTGRPGFRGRGGFRGGRRGDRRDDFRQRGGNFRGRGRDDRDRGRGRGGRGRGGRGRGGRGDHFRRDDDRRREQSAPESGKRIIPGLGRGAKTGINH
jgi:hypothetical protein